MQTLFRKRIVIKSGNTGRLSRGPWPSRAHRFGLTWSILLLCLWMATADEALGEIDFPARGAAPERWTLAFYLAGENSLERYQANSFRKIIEGAATLSDAHVVVFFDRDEMMNGETLLTSWKGTRAFWVRGPFAETIRRPLTITLPASIEVERFRHLILERLDDPDDRRRIRDAYRRSGLRYHLKPSIRAHKTDLAEILDKADYRLPLNGTRIVNLQATSETTLRQFMAFVRDQFPADHYALFMAGHGNGWYEQETRPPDDLKQRPPEYYQTLKSSAIAAATRWQPFDVLAMDSCLMADVETLWNMKDSADYLILNQIQTPAKGLDFRALLTHIAATPSITPYQVARATIAAYESTYKGPRYPVSATAFATAHIEDFVHQWQEFCALPEHRQRLLDAARTAVRIPSGTPTRQAMADLVQIIRDLDTPYLIDGITRMMVDRYRQYAPGEGLSIYLPADRRIMNRTLDLYRQTAWAMDFPQGWVKVVPELVASFEAEPGVGGEMAPPTPDRRYQ